MSEHAQREAATAPVLHQGDETRGVFLLEHAGERLAELTYREAGPGVVSADHTWVADRLRGHGVARRLVDACACWARAAGLRVVPACSYVRVLFERDPSFADVRA